MSEGDAPAAAVEALARVTAHIGGEHRPGQERMAREVAAALTGHPAGHLLVQAGTGTGKSLAYLVPGLLRAMADDGGPVIVATATVALQRQLIERDLPAIAEALAADLPREPRFAVLKGRHHYLCRLRLDQGAEPAEEIPGLDAGRLGRQAARVHAWAADTETGDRDDLPEPVEARVWRAVSVSGTECIGRLRCPHGEDCFAEIARDRAREADVVVTNHALLAIDVVEGVPVLPEHVAVVIDEGHEVIDRATQALSRVLGAGQVEQAIGRGRRLLPETLRRRLEETAEALTAAIAAVAPEGGTTRIDALTRDVVLALNDLRAAVREALSALVTDPDGEPQDAGAQRRVRAALDDILESAERILAGRADDVVWIDATRTPTLHLAPLSVGATLRRALFERVPVVMTSATLTVGGGFEPLAATLGLAPEASASASASGAEPGPGPGPAWTGIDVGSPFDHARQGILYVAAALPAPARSGVPEEALDELGDLIDAAGGRTLALFSSWRGVERAADYLRVRLGDRVPLLTQARGDAVGPLVDRFRDDPASVLIGTVTLWQGVDVPGDSCRLVVIDRIPFPRPDDPVHAARAAAVDAAGGSGFREIAVPRAALLLAQGVGRLIRGSTDRGVVAVLDPRLATAGYARLLRESLPPLWFTTDGAVVRAALARLDEGPG